MADDDYTTPSSVVPEVIRIGKADDNDAVVDDSFVSKYHVELRRLASGWDVRDLGSSNGTTLNGVQVHAAVAQFGDTLRIGHTELTLGVGGPRLLSSHTPRDAAAPSLTEAPIPGDPPNYPSLVAVGSTALAEGVAPSMESPVANVPSQGRPWMGRHKVLLGGGILALVSGLLLFGNGPGNGTAITVEAGNDISATVDALSLPEGCVWWEIPGSPYKRWSADPTGSIENASGLQVDNVALVAEILRDGQVIAIEDLAPFNVPAEPSGIFGVPLDRDWPIDPSTDTCRLTLTEHGSQPATGWMGANASVGESGTEIPSEVGPGECDELGFCAPPEGVPNDGRGGRTDEELEEWIGSRDYMCEVYGPDSPECADTPTSNLSPGAQHFLENYGDVFVTPEVCDRVNTVYRATIFSNINVEVLMRGGSGYSEEQLAEAFRAAC